MFMAAFFGLVLTVSDGIPSWVRLNLVIKVFVACATFAAFVGLLQAATSFDVTQYLTVPGLGSKGFVPELQDRGGALRVASTTLHYIELSTVLALALPFAIHLALFAPNSRAKRLAIMQALIIGACIPATISRTGIVAVGITMLCLLPLWEWRFRYNVLVLTGFLLAAVALARPSLARSLMEMFTGLSDDPSITSRTERYELVGYYFAQRPWLGRGTGTWVSPQYQYLDNQWLSTALCNGILGIAALALLHLVALGLAVMALRRAQRREDKHLCAILIATQLIALFVYATFDALWFSTCATVIALTVGMCGTVWRLTHPQHAIRTGAAPLTNV
jgi:O-antigen ligase